MEPSQLVQIGDINIETIISSIVSLLTGTAAGIFILRRRLSKDNVEITKDRAEGDLIHYLENQVKRIDLEREKHLNRLEKAEQERLQMTEKVFKLSAEVESLTLQLKVLRDLTNNLSNNIELYHKRVLQLEEENLELKSKFKSKQELLSSQNISLKNDI